MSGVHVLVWSTFLLAALYRTASALDPSDDEPIESTQSRRGFLQWGRIRGEQPGDERPVGFDDE